MLRIRIELVPHGIESASSVLDTIYVSNDGTGVSGGPDSGGIGNYEVHDNETLGHLATVDYPSMYACGFIKGVERTPAHRIFLAEQALGVVQEARQQREGLNPHDPSSPQITREIQRICRRAEGNICLDPDGYCTGGDCLAAK